MIEKPTEQTLGAIAPNERGENGILTRTGKYANRTKETESKFKGGLADGLHALREAQKAGLDEPSFQGQEATGTSIFDPVLCELCYKWFIPTGGSILDPFAGGSVRGIVAAELGHPYTGIDLSARQLAANEEQAALICHGLKPRWLVGDSRNLPQLLAPGELFDFVFACPPYFDLEVYSDHPADLSVCTWGEFCEAYEHIIACAAERLKPNRFAVFVVGDVRDKEGFYRGLPQVTTEAFARAGLKLYNAAVLVTSVGSLPIRAGKQFSSGRKLGNTHQHVLCYFKGDPKRIKKEFPSLNEFGQAEDEAVAGEQTEQPQPTLTPEIADSPPEKQDKPTPTLDKPKPTGELEAKWVDYWKTRLCDAPTADGTPT